MNSEQNKPETTELETKTVLPQSIFTNLDLSPAQWKANKADQYALEGYQKNVIAYRCIKEIADNIGSLEWQVINKRTGRVFDKHPVLDLLRRPNPGQSTTSFFARLESFKQISGNSYVQAVGPDNRPPKELYVLSPSKMTVVPGPGIMMPSRYEYKPSRNKSKTIKFDVDQVTGESQIMHVKTFNPLSDWYGQSPIQAAAFSIDLHNESSEWNMRLIQNGARPSGALIAKNGLAAEQRGIVKEAFTEAFTGAANAGKPLVMEGDLEWIDMMLSPKDMDWLESRSASARDIATAFRVPPILLNIGSDTTFANMSEARLSMIENTIIPEADIIQDELNNWLVPMFGDTIELRYNKDSIPSIINKRSEMYAKLEKADFLMVNEKRVLAGFPELTPVQMQELKDEKSPPKQELVVEEDSKEPVVKPKSEEMLIETKTKMEHYHKLDPNISGLTSETNDHSHNYVLGDIKTSIVNGHSHKVEV